jgi:GAF domain-containing protein
MSLDRITASIAEAAQRINQPDASLGDTLSAIAAAARDSIPGFDLAGISTVDARGRAETRAVTDPMVMTFDELQYSLDEGPCLDALGSSHVVVVPHIRHEQRWPRYVPEVARLGLRSQMAVKLGLDDNGTLGGINLYSTVRDDIDPDAESIAELFAIHAAAALGSAVRIDQLNQAMHTRKVIGQAIGIVMERYALNEDRAFQFLVRASSHGNLKLRDVAQQFVNEGNQR